MREPFTQLYVHLVWATWDRLPLLTAELQAPVYACIQAECRRLGVTVIAIGGVADHVHLLVRFPTTVSIAQILKQAKVASSHFVTHQLAPGGTFKWQGGYGAFTLAKSDVPRVREYILRQERHHSVQTVDESLELPPAHRA